MSRCGKPSDYWFDTVDQFDEVLISGVASCPSGVRFERLEAVVATVSRGDDGDYLKVWPKGPSVSGDGKIWFPASQVTEFHHLLPGEN